MISIPASIAHRPEKMHKENECLKFKTVWFKLSELAVYSIYYTLFFFSSLHLYSGYSRKNVVYLAEHKSRKKKSGQA